MKRPCQLIDPGLTAQGLYTHPVSTLRLTDDDQVKCLSYLAANLGKTADVPAQVQFFVIPVYRGINPRPYPAIGMFDETGVRPAETMINIAFTLGELLEQHIATVGIDAIMGSAAAQQLTWDEVLNDDSRT
jgi:hypothetical protein